MVEKLKVQVALDGADQVVSSFESIEQGATAAIGNITNLAKSMLSAFGPMGELVGGAAASFAGFALALERLTVSAAESAAEIRGLAIISGTSAEEMSALVSAFSAAGVSTEGLITNFRRLAQAVATELPKVRQEMKAAGDTIVSAELKSKEAVNALNKVRGDAATYNEKDIALKKAQIAVSEAQRASDEASANDIRKFVKYFDDLSNGVQKSTAAMNLSLDNLKKGLVGSLGDASTSLVKDMTGSLRAAADPTVQAMLLKLADIFKNMPDGVQKTALAVQLFGRNAGPSLIAFLNQGGAAVQAAKQRIVDLGLTLNDTEQGALKRFRIANFELADTLGRLKEKFSAAVSPAFTAALEEANHFLEEHTADIVKMGELTLNILTKLSEAWTAILPAIKLFGTAIGYASDGGAKLIAWGVQFTDWLTNYLVAGLITAVNWIDNLIDAFLRLIGVRGQAAGAPATAQGDAGSPSMARGGLLGGRGSGTSDSNLAWVSRGEHIMPAGAVAQPGVLAFLEALRRSGGNLSAVLNGMGHFALGGMVPRTMPAFATGGLAGGSHITIQFPGLPAISGLRASSDVVDQLHKAAALAQVRSGGRKPSRYS